MIPVHRLTDPDHEFFVNPDLILSVEATPDTVLTLTSHAKLVVGESPEQIVSLVRRWRAGIHVLARDGA
jgi:flagellar protein FlbD